MKARTPIKLFFLTGDRAEYDIQYPLIAAAARNPFFEVGVIVAGSHTVTRFGDTARAIRSDGFRIVAEIDTLLAADHPTARAKSAGIEIASIADVIRNETPDMLVVMGDREDALAGALVATYAEIPVVHLGGGDRGDNAHPDNPVRDAVSKLAHLHLTASEESAQRLRAMGEAAWRICVTGAPGLDRFAMTERVAPETLWAQLGVPPVEGKYLVVVQHVMPPEREDGPRQVRETLEAVLASGLPAFIGRPNSDSGSAALTAEIEAFAARHPRLCVYGNLDREAFVTLLSGAAAMVGNSSAGLIETPFLKLPAINIGRRQKGRQHAANVLHVDHDRTAIAAAINKALNDERFLAEVATAENPYGDGHAADRGLEFMENHAGDRARLLVKVQSLGNV
jgi:UDP-hydrolysing UDP-N-acetyl-D-glucosamine 2-epimerase